MYSIIYPISNLININTILPGIPNKPTKTAVIMFNPMWKFQILPIKFIINIKMPPNIEFNINFNIFLIGTINNLPNKKTIVIPDK